MAMHIICGLPGNGKSAYLTKLGIKYINKGYNVFSIYPISTEVRYKGRYYPITSFKLTKDMIADRVFPPNSVLLIDEIQNWYNSRDWASMSREDVEFFTGHRHMSLEIYAGVQSPSRVDVSIRQLCEDFVWLKKGLFLTKVTTYFAWEDIGKKDLDKEFYKVKYIKLGKKVKMSYNTKYLKDLLNIKEQDLFESFDYCKTPYKSIFQRIKEEKKLQKDFLLSLEKKGI